MYKSKSASVSYSLWFRGRHNEREEGELKGWPMELILQNVSMHWNGWGDGLVGKDAWCQAGCPESDFWVHMVEGRTNAHKLSSNVHMCHAMHNPSIYTLSRVINGKCSFYVFMDHVRRNSVNPSVVHTENPALGVSFFLKTFGLSCHKFILFY